MIDYTKLKLSHNKLLVRPLAGSETALEGGVIVRPEESRDQLRGIVVAKGPGALNERGDRIPIDTPIGALVFFGKYAGLELADGCGYLLLSDMEATTWLSPQRRLGLREWLRECWGQRRIVALMQPAEFEEIVHVDFQKNHLAGEGCELCREAEKPAHDAFMEQQRALLLASRST